MRLSLLTAVAAAALILAAGAGASSGQSITRHDRQVIRFFQHHPKLAMTPAGQRALWNILGRVVSRQVQSAAVARLVNGDWSDAVQYADRIWPGTAGWLWSCSASEGGHGRWVPNSGGSGAGGWMQFLNGTFYNNVDSAFAEAKSRGYVIPAAARSWYSSLGQAVTGAYMAHHGWQGQWYGGGC